VSVDSYQEEDYAKRLKGLTHLAELCVELLRQNDEHYADVCKTVIIIVLII